MLNNRVVFNFNTEEELKGFLRKHTDINEVPIDKECLRIRYLKEQHNGKEHQAFLRIKEADEAQFIFKPSVGYSFVPIDINQTNLFDEALLS